MPCTGIEPVSLPRVGDDLPLVEHGYNRLSITDNAVFLEITNRGYTSTSRIWLRLSSMIATCFTARILIVNVCFETNLRSRSIRRYPFRRSTIIANYVDSTSLYSNHISQLDGRHCCNRFHHC